MSAGMREALELANQMVASHYPRHREYKVAAALIASQAAQGDAVAGRTVPRNDDERACAQFFADNPSAAVVAYGLYTAPPAPDVPDGFSQEDLEDTAEWLESEPKTVNLGPLEVGFADSHIESGAAFAARFIRAMLAAAPEVPRG